MTCAVVTTAANDAIAPLHDRMPALLPPSGWPAWLDPTHDADEVRELLQPAPPEELVIRPVTPRVNDAANDGPDLLADAPAPDESASLPLPGLAV